MVKQYKYKFNINCEIQDIIFVKSNVNQFDLCKSYNEGVQLCQVDLLKLIVENKLERNQFEGILLKANELNQLIQCGFKHPFKSEDYLFITNELFIKMYFFIAQLSNKQIEFVIQQQKVEYTFFVYPNIDNEDEDC